MLQYIPPCQRLITLACLPQSHNPQSIQRLEDEACAVPAAVVKSSVSVQVHSSPKLLQLLLGHGGKRIYLFEEMLLYKLYSLSPLIFVFAVKQLQRVAGEHFCQLVQSAWKMLKNYQIRCWGMSSITRMAFLCFCYHFMN